MILYLNSCHHLLIMNYLKDSSQSFNGELRYDLDLKMGILSIDHRSIYSEYCCEYKIAKGRKNKCII